MKLNQVFLVANGGSIETPFNSTEIRILPYLGVIAHHLPVLTLDYHLGRANSCTIHNGVIEGENLKYLLSFSVEKMNTVTEIDFIKPLQIEQTAMIRESSLLPVCCNPLDHRLRLIPSLFRKNKVGYDITAIVLLGPIGCKLK